VLRSLLLRAQPILSRGRLTVAVWRGYERLVAARSRGHDAKVGADGQPLPPKQLRVRTVRVADPEVFLASGANDAEVLSSAASGHGLPIDDARRLLDFGCGCGRVTRHWPARALEIHACDQDEIVVRWVSSNLPAVRAQLTHLRPPLPYPDRHFDIVYAISVFTHFTDDLNRAWMRELHRVIRPSGLLLFSVMAPEYLDRLRAHESRAFARAELVVQFDEGVGTNLCIAYHPAPYIHEIARGFECERAAPIGAQELWVGRRLDGVPA
jgi:SAM-dependent methyltransferase